MDPNGPRERARDAGLAALADTELLALVIGSGTSGASAHALALAWIEGAGGITHLDRGATPPPGIGAVKALRVLAALELGKRASVVQAAPRARFEDPSAVARWATPRLAHLEHEELWLLALDRRCRLRAARELARGSLRGLSLEVSDVFRTALREGAATFVLVHNHPSGDPTPSAEDVGFTAAVARGAATLGVPLADHVVVARDGFAQVAFG